MANRHPVEALTDDLTTRPLTAGVRAPTEELTGRSLAALFDAAPHGTIGIEEELMLLDPETLELAPRAGELLERLAGDPRFKPEFPAAQIEIVLGPFPDVHTLAPALRAAREQLAERARDLVLLAGAGVHPFSSGLGQLNSGERYRRYASEYGPIAHRQLVFALQVHVAIGGAQRTLAVYNHLRDHLPLLAALSANAPFYEGRDCGLASVRPKLGELLPRQGIPPAIASWEQYAEWLAWGHTAGALPGPQAWWWELRPHPGFGTLELRVPDAQASQADVLAVTAVTAALARRLAARWEGGDLPVVHTDTLRLEENRWSACRYGVHGTMADLRTGEPRATRELLLELLAGLAPELRALAGDHVLARAVELAAQGPADALRAAAAGNSSEAPQPTTWPPRGMRDATRWLAEGFLVVPPG